MRTQGAGRPGASPPLACSELLQHLRRLGATFRDRPPSRPIVSVSASGRRTYSRPGSIAPRYTARQPDDHDSWSTDRGVWSYGCQGRRRSVLPDRSTRRGQDLSGRQRRETAHPAGRRCGRARPAHDRASAGDSRRTTAPRRPRRPRRGHFALPCESFRKKRSPGSPKSIRSWSAPLDNGRRGDASRERGRAAPSGSSCPRPAGRSHV